MVTGSGTYRDRRRRGDRRRGMDRRSGTDRRAGEDRRGSKDRRAGWNIAEDQRLQGVLTTAAAVAHLFSQALTVIMGHVDLLSLSTKEDETKRKLKIMSEQLDLLTIYLQKLREISRYKTIDYHGIVMLDLDLLRNKANQ
jgi:signal transduction histidine kinase